MKTKGLRWWVVGLVALAAVINYIDRQAFGALWPDIAEELFPGKDKDYTKGIYGTISAVFILSYAAGQTIFGKIFDWIGTNVSTLFNSRRKLYTSFFNWWAFSFNSSFGRLDTLS